MSQLFRLLKSDIQTATGTGIRLSLKGCSLILGAKERKGKMKIADGLEELGPRGC